MQTSNRQIYTFLGAATISSLYVYSVQNHGVARQIPERADAGKLLENFYYEVATPLLRDVEFRYSRGIQTNSLSSREFSNYFNGSELVVVGKLLPNLRYGTLRSYAYGSTSNRDLTLTSRGDILVIIFICSGF